ncbi:hypothetical protein [Paenibacillus sp. FSL R10-2734]
MYRTVMQLFGVLGPFFNSIGPYSSYCHVFAQKQGTYERIAATESDSEAK